MNKGFIAIMKLRSRLGVLRASLCAAASVAIVGVVGVICTPVMALAEDEGVSAFDLLIPKPEEFIPALVAFLIIWFVLAKFIWPSVVKTLDERQETIQNDLDQAEQNKLNTEKAFKEAQREIDKAQNKADDIVAEAKRQADATRAAILADASKDAKHIADKARENIEIERENAETDLTHNAANLAVDLATKIVHEKLDQKTQERLLKDALKAAEQESKEKERA